MNAFAFNDQVVNFLTSKVMEHVMMKITMLDATLMKETVVDPM